MKIIQFFACMLITASLPGFAASATQDQCRASADWLRLAPGIAPHHRAATSLLATGTNLKTAFLGIGIIHPEEDKRFSNWLETTTLPISETPGAEPTRLLANGWLLDVSGAGTPLSMGGLVETEYESNSLLVLKRQDDWLQIRLAPPGEENESGWVRECALHNNQPGLSFVPWEKWLISDHLSPLYYRNPTGYNLRDGPGTRNRKLLVISGDHILRVREIRGDWMRVEVSMPSDYCGRVQVTRRNGWIRWRSAKRGPWVWYYSRGC